MERVPFFLPPPRLVSGVRKASPEGKVHIVKKGKKGNYVGVRLRNRPPLLPPGPKKFPGDRRTSAEMKTLRKKERGKSLGNLCHFLTYAGERLGGKGALTKFSPFPAQRKFL